MKNKTSIIIWGMTLVAIVATFTAKAVIAKYDYETGYNAAMKEAVDFGLAEKFAHTEYGDIYCWIPRKMTLLKDKHE